MIQILCHLWGDYILQSDWMAQNKTKRSFPALAHALLYSLCFVPLCWRVAPIQLLRIDFIPPDVYALTVIFWTHFLIDRYRLARYVVWAKNFMSPRKDWYPRLRDSWDDCKATGYPPSTPIWLSTWLLIIADNTLHMTINYLALRYL